MHTTKIALISAAALLVVGCDGKKEPGNAAGNTVGNTVAPGSGKPHGPGTGQQVDLIWKQGTNSWKVKLNNGPEQDPATATTSLALNVGPTMFTVNIGGSATFKDPGALDVWEGPGAKSSPQSGINSTQILGPIITKNGKTLIFYDMNYGSGVTINYRLNFNNGVPSVDPIIDNGGGTWN